MLQDTSDRYGLISRTLHWGMTLLLAWHFFGASCRALLGRDSALATFVFSGTHRQMGTLLFVLIVLRLLWVLVERHHRPAYRPDTLGRLARIGHWLMYALMLLVPSLGLLRQYGSGRGFAPFGLPLMENTGVRVDWMMAPANAVHGLLGWTLLLLIAGHIVMACVHHFALRDGLMRRMV